jgi:hypothetical protein
MFAVKTIVVIWAVVAMLAALALTPYARARWEFYRLTGCFTPQRIVETLQRPVRIGSITEEGLLTADGKFLAVPGITNLVISDPVKKDITEHGVETAPDGAIYALVRVHHWCGHFEKRRCLCGGPYPAKRLVRWSSQDYKNSGA